MSHAQRSYTDAAATSRDQHVLNRSIGGNAGDVMAVQHVGDALDFGGSSTGTIFDAQTSTGFGTLITCDGFEEVVLKIETEKSSPTVKVRPWWLDASGKAIPGDKVTAQMTGTQDSANTPANKSTYYHAETIVLPTNGAKQMRLELTNISNGAVSVWYCPR